MRITLIAAASLLLSACSLDPVYRMELQQGNLVTQEMVKQLKPGMTKDQVRFVLGTPLVTDIFHDDRWDYIYRYSAANSTVVEERRLSVHFRDGKLVRLEGDIRPERRSGGAGSTTVSQGE